MAMRDFEDQNGTTWTVWDTVPATTTGLTDEYRRGWLTFDNGTDRCRLAPIPPDWAELSAERLTLLLVAHTAALGDTNVTSLENERRVAERRQQQERRTKDRRQNPVTHKGP
jgi:hypothetical protein